MRNGFRRKHMIDVLFPVALFFVFAVSSITVILLAAGIYESTTSASSLNDASRTSLAYVSEKVHQSDSGSQAALGAFDGCPALMIRHDGEQEGYTTYIYGYENELKELLIKNGAEADASAGKTIMKVDGFQIEELQKGLFRVSCTDAEGRQVSTLAALRSAK